MTDGTDKTDLAFRLHRLLDKVKISEADRYLAGRCIRRIEQPLRLTIVGTDPDYAIPLLNLMIGQAVVSPAMKRARIHFLYSEVPFAKIQYRGGRQKRIDGRDFRRLFEDNPSRVRIYLNLPVLKRMCLQVAVDTNAKALCADADKTLGGADITVWTGGELTDQMRDIWGCLPRALKDHSYLALAQRADISPWQEIQNEFVDVLRVNPIRAHNAKAGPNGADKEAFRAAGGSLLVKTMKSEIEMLVTSAFDTAEILLERYAEKIAAIPNFDDPDDVVPKSVKDVPSVPDEPSLAARIAPDLDELPSLDEVDPALIGHLAQRPKQMPITRKRAASQPRTHSGPFPNKNMPVRDSRPISKLGSKPRIRSRAGLAVSAASPFERQHQ